MAYVLPIKHTTPEVIACFFQMYRAGVLVRDIAKQTGFSRFTVHKYLRLLGEHRYEPRPTHSINDAAFDTLSLAGMYWLGFLLTDGSINRDRIKLFLSIKDEGAIIALREFVAYTGPVEYYKKSVGIRFTSAHMAGALRQHGMIERKSFIVRATDACAVSRDFWRGAFDGDGGICYKKHTPVVTFTSASKVFADQYADFINKHIQGLEAHAQLRPRRKTTLYDVREAGYAARLVPHFLYDNASTYKLPRKVQAMLDVDRYQLKQPSRSKLYGIHHTRAGAGSPTDARWPAPSADPHHRGDDNADSTPIQDMHAP